MAQKPIRSLSTVSVKAPRVKRAIIMRKPKLASVTPQIKEKKPFPWRPIVRIIVLSLMVVGAVWLLNSPLFAVRTVKVEGIQATPQDAVVAAVPKHSNLWLFPIKETKTKIKKVSPYIADVAIYRGVPDTVRIVIAEKVLALDWQSGDKHFIIGLDGKVITEGTKDSLTKIVDTTGFQPQGEAAVVTPGFVQFAMHLQEVAKNTVGLDIDHLEIGETTFDVTIVPKAGPKILVDSSRSGETQLQAAKLVIDQFKDAIKQYVDMRVPEKAYYQ